MPEPVELRTMTRQLAPLTGYSIKHPGAVTSVLEWLYAFVLYAGDQREWLLHPGTGELRLTDDWSLAKAQDADTVAEYGPSRKGKPCGHVFKRGETVYRCLDCAVDGTCVFCARCFHASTHDGHEISVHIHSTGCGCCDCGDPEAWKVPIDCKYHSVGADGAASATESPSRVQPPADMMRKIRVIISEAIDFVLATISRCPDETRAARSTTSVRAQLSPEEVELGKTQGDGPWAAVLWNDEKHSYTQVITTVMRALPGTTREAAREMAVRIDTYVGFCFALCVLYAEPSLG
jgi:E3 ubiquitin-protein ligase UBR1